MNIKERMARMKIDIPAIFLAMKDRKTPWLPKVLGALTVAYALSPVDLIPDFIPIIGFLDDAIIIPAMAAWTISMIPKDVMEISREKAERLWENGKPKRWYYALPIVVVWILLIGFIVKIIWF